MGEFEELLGDMGVEQWVRNKFVAQLKGFREAGSVNVDKFIADFNRNVLDEFTAIARKTIDDTIKRATELLDKSGGSPTTPNVKGVE